MARKSRRTDPDAPQAPLTATEVRSVARALQSILVELQGGAAFQLTRLTRVKPLCADEAAARQFAAFIAGRALARLTAKGQAQPSYASAEQWASLMALAPEGVTRLEQYLAGPTPQLAQALHEHARNLYRAQSQQQHIPYGAARVIVCWEALLIETAIRLALARSPEERARYGYEVTSDYVRRYRSDSGEGLNRDSAEPLAEVVSFWMGYADALATAEAAAKQAG